MKEHWSKLSKTATDWPKKWKTFLHGAFSKLRPFQGCLSTHASLRNDSTPLTGSLKAWCRSPNTNKHAERLRAVTHSIIGPRSTVCQSMVSACRNKGKMDMLTSANLASANLQTTCWQPGATWLMTICQPPADNQVALKQQHDNPPTTFWQPKATSTGARLMTIRQPLAAKGKWYCCQIVISDCHPVGQDLRYGTKRSEKDRNEIYGEKVT